MSLQKTMGSGKHSESLKESEIRQKKIVRSVTAVVLINIKQSKTCRRNVVLLKEENFESFDELKTENAWQGIGRL
jgi:hypothetical protein